MIPLGKRLLFIALLVVFGCEDKEDSGIVESVSGTYYLTSLSYHSGGDCSADDGITGICLSDPSSIPEADCPEGEWQSFVYGAPHMTLTFTETGFSDNVDISGIWELDGSILTVIVSPHCYELDGNRDFASNPTACSASGGSSWNKGYTLGSGIVSGSTFILEHILYRCYDGDLETDAADSTACSASGGNWVATKCYASVYTFTN